MADPDDKPWTFLTNHARVLVRIANDPSIRIRDIAGEIGITERTAQQIVTDLEQAGYLTRDRVGRRNLYTVAADAPLRHPADSDRDLRTLIALLTDPRGVRHEEPEAGQAEPRAEPSWAERPARPGDEAVAPRLLRS